jgi:peptide deformylase
MNLIFYPNPALHEVAQEVEQIDELLVSQLSRMTDLMYEHNGIGLAGPQVGLSKRVVVMSVPDGEHGDLELINPKILAREGSVEMREGCLSLPKVNAKLTRSAIVEVSYLDKGAVERRIVMRGLEAVCVQHEIDHLDGIMFIDHLSPIVRRLLLKAYRKHAASRRR